MRGVFIHLFVEVRFIVHAAHVLSKLNLLCSFALTRRRSPTFRAKVVGAECRSFGN